MKPAIILLLLCAQISSFGQTKDSIPNPIRFVLPQFDSLKIDPTKLFADARNIKSITVLYEGFYYKGLNKDANGTIIFKKKPKLLSLAQIASKMNIIDSFPEKFSIDDKQIEDTSNVLIEASIIQQTTVSINADQNGINCYAKPIKLFSIITTLHNSQKPNQLPFRLIPKLNDKSN